MRRVRLLILVVLSLVALVFVYGQSPQLPQSVKVTRQSIASKPGSKPYVIDSTRNGRTYNVSADVANRIQIRTSNGKMSLSDLMGKLGLTNRKFRADSNFLIGTPSDLRAVNFGRSLEARRAGGSGMSLKCGVFICECDPDIEGDCNGRIFFCAALPMVCWVCEGPDCPPEQQHRWTCSCIKA